MAGFLNDSKRVFPLPDPGVIFPPFLSTEKPSSEDTFTADSLTLPVFCSKSKMVYSDCNNSSLIECEHCSVAGASVFMTLVAILGVAIVVGNLLVLLVVRNRKVKGKLENMDLHRTSLAAADLLTGIQILIITTYNFAWCIHTSPKEVALETAMKKNSTLAKIGGIFFTLTFSSSVYNLTFLAGQRLYAFVRPIEYKLQRKRTISVWIGVVWIVAIASSTSCAWFPEHFNFAYTSNTFLFYPNFAKDSLAAGAILFVVTLVLPYVLTTSFLIASAAIVHSHFKKAAKSRKVYRQTEGGEEMQNSKNNEVGFFVTTALMQFGFTLSVVPCAVVIVLVYSSPNLTLTSELADAYAICMYISMLNSLVNVLVYSIRDSKFRSEVSKVLGACCFCCSSEISKGTMRKLRSASHRKIPLSASSGSSTGMTGTDGNYAKKLVSTSA